MTETERCLTCNGEGKYWTRKRDGDRVPHVCDACQGTGRITLPEAKPEDPLPVTTTKASEPSPEAPAPQ
jgi:DnaJ-class molecular chaperone